MLNAIKKLILPEPDCNKDEQYEAGYHAGTEAIKELIAEFNEKAPQHSRHYEEGFLDAMFDYIST